VLHDPTSATDIRNSLIITSSRADQHRDRVFGAMAIAPVPLRRRKVSSSPC